MNTVFVNIVLYVINHVFTYNITGRKRTSWWWSHQWNDSAFRGRAGDIQTDWLGAKEDGDTVAAHRGVGATWLARQKRRWSCLQQGMY